MLTLYYAPFPPCMAALMVVRELGLDINIKPLEENVEDTSHWKAIEPNVRSYQPILVDDGDNITLWDSRSIMIYLVDKFGGDSKLYPSDVKTRALINQCLFFDINVLTESKRMAKIKDGKTEPDELEDFLNRLKILDSLLKGKEYYANTKERSLADLSLISVLMATTPWTGVELDKFPNIYSFYKKIRAELPYDKEINMDEIEKFVETLIIIVAPRVRSNSYPLIP